MPIFSSRKDLRRTMSSDIFIDLRARIIAAPRLAIAKQEEWIFKRRDNWLWYPPYVLPPSIRSHFLGEYPWRINSELY